MRSVEESLINFEEMPKEEVKAIENKIINNKMNKMIYRDEKYDKKFGTLVRKLDREQAQENER